MKNPYPEVGNHGFWGTIRYLSVSLLDLSCGELFGHTVTHHMHYSGEFFLSLSHLNGLVPKGLVV
jgi:hypothetical protein